MEEKNFILIDLNNSEYDWYYYKQEETYYFSWAYKHKICDVIVQYDLNGKEIERFQSIEDTKRKTGANNISQVLSGKYKTSKNYKFKKLKNQQYVFNSSEKEEMIKKNLLKPYYSELHNDNYITMTNFKITRKVKLHILIYVCKNGEGLHKCCDCNKEFSLYIFNNESPKNFHIDHIDNNHNNNDDSNLQLLCPSCHGKKTNRNNPNRIHKNGGTIKSIIVYKEGDEEFKKEYSKIRDAISELDIQLKEDRITYSLKTGKYVGSKKHSNRYKFVHHNQMTNVDEIFKKHPHLNIEISNHGRIKNSNGINIGTYKEGYMMTSVIKKSYRIHRLVLETFRNEELQEKAKEIKKIYLTLSTEDIINSRRKPYSIIVDHIDQNKINNKLENLRWSTYTENSLNTKRSRKIKQWSMKGEFIKEFNSQTECCIELFGKYDTNIIKVLSGERKHLKQYIFTYSNEKEPEKTLSVKEKQYNLYKNIFSSITNFIDAKKRKPKITINDEEECAIANQLNNLNKIYINKEAAFKNDDIYSLWNQIINSEKYKKYFENKK